MVAKRLERLELFLYNCKANFFISLGKPICCGLEIFHPPQTWVYHDVRKGKALGSLPKTPEVALMLG